MEKGGCTYIVTNQYNTVLYTGVSSDLKARVWEHKNHHYPNAFTAKYKCNKLVWYECFFSIEEAILREKEIKGWKRYKKIALIEAFNPDWRDLSNSIT